MTDIMDIKITEGGMPVAPTDEQWDALAGLKQQSLATKQAAPATVDIIIPVYSGMDETLACVFAAVATTFDQACEVLLINDGSPEPPLVHALECLSQRGLFTLLHNDSNLGFVRTVNRGMALHEDRDVVLLNSDAIVYGNWLERLRNAALSQDRIASVTPLSNNAEICSYPKFVENNHLALELDDASLDGLAAACNAGCWINVPTGVGFCMYIRRACLAEVGYFDAEKFGKGYGEENDFCLRATSKGWTHLLATDVFVRHCGGVSFGDGKAALVQNGLRVLAKDWPDYEREIHAFVKADPVFEARKMLDAARVGLAGKAAKTMLFVVHAWGGGIERNVQAMMDALRQEGIGVLVMRAPRGRDGWVAFEHSLAPQLPNLRFRIAEDYQDVVALLRRAGVFHVHVHSFAGYPVDGSDFIRRLATDLAVSYDYTAHDYLPHCPRITMIGGDGVYCGDPDEAACITCIRKNGAPVPVESVPAYRQRYREFLRGARKVYAPCEDVKVRFERWFPFLNVSVRPHPHGYRFMGPPPVRYRGEGILRVAVIGAIGPHKGSALLLECARHAAEHALPIRFVIFGITDNAELEAHPYVSLTGAYQEGDVGRMLAGYRCHLAFFPSVWPETWSYTLGESLDMGLFPVAFELGAMAERINRIGWGECLPVALMKDAAGINERLLTLRASKFTPEVRERIRQEDQHYSCMSRDYYMLSH